MKPKSEKVEQFCYEVGFLTVQHVRAYIHSYPNNKYPHQCAFQLLQKPYIQERILYWQSEKAKEVEKKQAKDAARLMITRERQTAELEKLRKKCMHKAVKDYPTALGCLREEDKVHGLVLDVSANGDEKLAEIDEKLRLAAASIPDSYLLPELKLPAPVENSASQNAPELKQKDAPKAV